MLCQETSINKCPQKTSSLNFILIIYFIINSIVVQAQGDDLIFDQIFLEEGLSQSIVKCILQDEEGFMYFGTEDGLNRYDVYTFTVMRNNPQDTNSLSYNDINAMCLDKEGNIWIGTFNSGLNKYNPFTKKIIRFTHDHKYTNTISHNNITAICADSSGIIWVGTDNGLNKLTPKDTNNDEYSIERIIHLPGNPKSLSHNTIYSLMLDLSSNLWVGTEDGLNLITQEHIKSKQIEFEHFKSVNNLNTLSNNTIRVIYQDKNGSVWIGTDRGLNAVLKNSKNEYSGFRRYLNIPTDNNSLSHNEVYALCEDNSGKLWIGTNGGG